MNNTKCNFKGCDEIGEYKAPASPQELRNYKWFCLKHIKEYNKKWNYFAEMSADQIEEFIENDIIGHRKTREIGSNDTSYFEKISKISEKMFSGMNNLENLMIHPSYYSSKYLNALATLGVENKNSSMDEIKSRFKKIVKELHADTVGQSEKNKDKLAKVLEAYKIIKEQYDNNGKSKSQ